MGLVYVEVAISNPAAPEVSTDVTMLVDTGATLSLVPASLLDNLGVRREGARRFRGFGGNVTRHTGIVRLSYEGVSEGVSVVFGMEDDPPILGVTALEVLGYQVDPVGQRLIRVDMLLL